MMLVRNYLIALVLVCTLGGLLLGAYLIERQQSFDRANQASADLQQHQHDLQRLEDHIKQLSLSVDLLFGAGETYMLDAALSQSILALKLSSVVAQGLHESHGLEHSLHSQIQHNLERLRSEIVILSERSELTELAISSEQLDTTDEITAILADSISLLKLHTTADAEQQQSERTSTRSKLDIEAWLVVALYLACVFGALRWVSGAVSGPLAELSRAARAALDDQQPFEANPEGPTEVRELTTHIGQFVQSLEYTITQNAALIQAIPDTLFVVHQRHGVTMIKPGIDTPKTVRKLDPSWASLSATLGESQSNMILQNVQACLMSQEQKQFDVALGLDGQKRFYEARATAISRDEVAIVIRDLTAKREAESRIEHLAYHDGLTGLLNRRAFMTSLSSHFQSQPEDAFALLYIDVDRFKTINDTKGHDIGDAVLKHITACLARCLRSNDRSASLTDSNGGCSARVGGDEFVVLLPKVGNVDSATGVANRLMNAMSEPFTHSGSQISVTVSVGVALYPVHGDSEQELMNHADLAMFQAKRSGGGTVRVYDQSLGDQNQQKLSIEARLKEALRNEDLFLAYQPKIELATGRISGAEALVRWQDGPTVIPPDQFIPIAEESGLILTLGDFVIETALQQMALWRQQSLALDSIAINVSAAQLKQPTFFESVSNACKRYKLAPELVNLEITESLLMDDYDTAVELLQTLRGGGFSIALDDFGTGYSSLSHVKELPLDHLKIDRAFVSGVIDSPKERAIAETIIGLGRTLGLKVVAEGVETSEQATFLQGCLCDEAQGYLYSPPVSPETFAEMLKQQATNESFALQAS